MAKINCPGFFSDCADFFKHMTFDLFWKWLIAEDSNGCPAVRVTGTINAQVTPAIPVQRTLPVAVDDAGSSGNVAAGAKWVEIITPSDFVGTINGANYPAGFSKFYPPLPNGDTYPQINWTKTSGSNVRIEYLT